MEKDGKSLFYFETKVKIRPSRFDLEKCFLKPHCSKTQIPLVAEHDGGRRRGPATPRQAYPGGLPADFPTKAAVDRYQDEWAQSQAAAAGGGGGGEAEAAGAEAAHQPGAN